MTKKIIFSLLLAGFLMAPLSTFALANTYQACPGELNESGECPSAEVTVCYEGVVPCGQGKECWQEGNASGGSCEGGTSISEGIPCQLCHFFVMLKAILNYFLFTIIPAVAIVLIAWGGVRMIFAGGDPKGFKEGQNIIKWVVIGLVIIFGAWLFTNLLFNLIGVQEWTGLRGGWFEIDCPIEIP